MNRRFLFALWGTLFIVCAALGFIPEPAGFVRFLLTALSLVFFLPPAVLVYQASRAQDPHLLKLLRNLSALSLGLTLVILVLNFLMALRSAFLGNVLHYLLIIVSSPMACSGYWALSLFLWACLLMGCLKGLKRE